MIQSKARNKAVLIAAGLLVGLLLAELLLRAAGVSYPLLYAPDEHCGTRLQPGFRGRWTKEGGAAIRINRHGFRHGTRQIAKPPGTFRVAVLGDSFIEALQVDQSQTLCAALERKLASCSELEDRPVQALNFGVSGFGTAQELQMLRHYVWPYEPDLVVLACFPANDVRNNSAQLEPDQARPFFRWAPRDDRREKAPSRFPWERAPIRLDDGFLEHPDYVKARSAAVRYKVRLINRSRLLQLLNESLHRTGPPAAAAGARIGQGLDDAALAEPADPDWLDAWKMTDRLVLEVRRECLRHQVPLLLLVIGSDAQVHLDPGVQDQLRRRLGVEDLGYADRRLGSLGRRHGFAVLSLAEPMRAYGRQHGQYLYGFDNTSPGAGHWNAAGHSSAGCLTARALCDLLKRAASSPTAAEPDNLPELSP